MMRLEDKVVVVTGASTGIGLEIAKALLSDGARVAFTARSKAKLDEEVARTGSDRAMAIEMDVTDEASVGAAIDRVIERFGRIDVLVNNAGNAGEMSLWAAHDGAFTRSMFDVHVLGADRTIRAVLPSMRARGSGTIVNFASTLAWVPMPGAAAYSAAKAAIVSLSETLRDELASDGIDVRLYAPPHTSTESGLKMPLDLPKIFEPEWVARNFIGWLRKGRARAVPGGNGFLLLLQRISPRWAASIMRSLGFKALAKRRLMLAAR